MDSPRSPYRETTAQIGHVHLGLLLGLLGVLLLGLWGAAAWLPFWAAAEALQWRRGAGRKMVRDAAKDGAFWAGGSWAGMLVAVSMPAPDAWAVWGIIAAGAAAAVASGAFVKER